MIPTKNRGLCYSKNGLFRASHLKVSIGLQSLGSLVCFISHVPLVRTCTKTPVCIHSNTPQATEQATAIRLPQCRKGCEVRGNFTTNFHQRFVGRCTARPSGNKVKRVHSVTAQCSCVSLCVSLPSRHALLSANPGVPISGQRSFSVAVSLSPKSPTKLRA